MAIIRGDRKLGDLKASHKTPNSFHKAMRMDARDRYIKADGNMFCKVCGKIEVHICHIKHIKEFDDNTEIEIINDPKNLIALCAYHHRLFDKRKSA